MSNVNDWQNAARTKLADLTGYKNDKDVPQALPANERGIGMGLMLRTYYLKIREGLGIPVTLLWDKNIEVAESVPVMLCLQGTNSGAHLSWGESLMPADPLKHSQGLDYGVQAVQQGYLAVCIEQSCFGERRERQLDRASVGMACIDASNHALLLGRCLIGERASDVSSVINWLGHDHCGFSIDQNRIHIMGNSSGGTTALYASALDTRIAATLAASCVGFLRSTNMKRGDGSGQNVVPGILQWFELDSVIGLTAPRPFLTVSGRADHIWPYDGAVGVIESAREIYAAAGAGNKIDAMPGDGGHRFYPNIAWPTFQKIITL